MAAPELTEKKPGYFAVYFYGTLSALIGAVLGFFYMASFPSLAFANMAEQKASIEIEEDRTVPPSRPGDGFYIEGAVARNRAWEVKRQQLTAGQPGQVSLSALDINSWMAARIRPADTSGEDAPSVMVLPGTPNVAFLEDGTVYLNIPAQVTMYGAVKDYTVSARGTVDVDGLSISGLSVSGGVVPFPSMIGSHILEALVQGYEATEEYSLLMETWERTVDARVSGGELLLDLR